MKLINADTLKRKFNETNVTALGIYPNNVVDSCTEIKAIPISWIRNYAIENHSETIRKMLNDWKIFNSRK